MNENTLARRSMEIVRNPRRVDIPERELCPYTQRVEDYAGERIDPVSRALMWLHLRRCESCRGMLYHIAPQLEGAPPVFASNVFTPAFAAASTLGAGQDDEASVKATVLLHEKEPRAYNVDIIKTRISDGVHWRVQVKVSPPFRARPLTIALAACRNGERGADFHSVAGNALDIVLPDGTYDLTFTAAQDSDHLLFELQ